METLPDKEAIKRALRQDTYDSQITVTPANRTSKLHFRETDHLDQPIHLYDAQPPSNIQHEHSELDSEHISTSFNCHSTFRPPPVTPSARTGPPRSLSFGYGLPVSPSTAKANGYFNDWAESAPPDSSVVKNGDITFSPSAQQFRGALEYRDQQDRKGKRRQRERNPSDDSWNINPIRWFQESPKEEKPAMDFPTSSVPAHDLGDEKEENPVGSTSDPEPKSTSTSFFRRPKRGVSANESGAESPPTAKKLRRAFSVPHRTRANTDGTQKDKDVPAGTAKWAKLRAFFPHIVHPQEILPGPSVVTPQAVNITDELITGGLSTLMLRLWFERDEKGHRRIPALFHRLRIRVSDSLHPMHRQASVFRIECEYANGAVRWVVYRELRDFISLHAHYAVSNVYNRNVDHMPEFPKTSLPYFKFLKEKGDRVGKADFARLQREALENYLVELIRAVVRPLLF